MTGKIAMSMQLGKRLKAGGFRTGRAFVLLGVAFVALAVLASMSAQVQHGRDRPAAAPAHKGEADSFVDTVLYLRNSRAAGPYPTGNLTEALQASGVIPPAAPWAQRLSAVGHDGVVTLTDHSAPVAVCAALMSPQGRDLTALASARFEVVDGAGNHSTSGAACVAGTDVVATLSN